MTKQKTSFWIIISLLTYVVGHSFVAVYMAQETTIYQWDLVTFWKKWIYYVDLAPQEPLEALKVFVRHTRYGTYGDIPSLLCAPMGWLLGSSRSAYIHCIAAMLAMPALFCGMFPMQHYFRLRGVAMGRMLAGFSFLCLALFLPLWRPVVRGNVGAGAVAVAFIILYLWFKKPLKEQSLKTLILLGLLLAFLPLYRRWMAFWVVSFFVSVGLFDILPLLWREGVRSVIKQGLRVSVAGITATGLMLLVAFPALQSMWLVDYKDVYAAYNHSRGLWRVFELWLWHFGPLCFAGVLWGLISGLKNSATRKWTGFLFVHFLLSFFLFARTQDFAEHHYYLLAPIAALLMVQGLSDAVLRIKSKALSRVAIGLLLFFMLLQFVFTFFPQAHPKLRWGEPVFAKWVSYPMKRGDLEQVGDLLDCLSEQVEGYPDAVIYTLASSFVISDNLLREAHLVLPRKMDIRDHLISVGHIDRIDLFPHALITADFVVVCDPPQIHLVEEEQEIVIFPTRHFLEQRGIAEYFEPLPGTFILDKETRVSVYSRTAAVSPEAIQQLENELGTTYVPLTTE